MNIEVMMTIVVSQRESIEWFNLWWENANFSNIKSALCIGDSVLRQVRGSLQNIMGVPCSFLGTSASYNDEMFFRELEFFFSFEEYKFSCIIIQLNSHGLKDFSYTEENYKRLFNLLQKRSKKIFVLSLTHVTFPNSQKDNFEVNELVLKANAFTYQYCLKHQFPFLDLYNIMKNSGYRHVDHIHFERAADVYMASEIGKFVINNSHKKSIKSFWGVTYICETKGKTLKFFGVSIYKYRKKKNYRISKILGIPFYVSYNR